LTKLEGDFRDDIIVDTLKNGIWLDNSNLVFSLSISSGPQVFNETIQKLVGVVIGEVLFDLLRVCLDYTGDGLTASSDDLRATLDLVRVVAGTSGRRRSRPRAWIISTSSKSEPQDKCEYSNAYHDTDNNVLLFIRFGLAIA
jgi:hypothetical protein